MARALKEWLKDLAARWSSVCKNTSVFRGLKLSPSSRQTTHTQKDAQRDRDREKKTQTSIHRRTVAPLIIICCFNNRGSALWLELRKKIGPQTSKTHGNI